MKFLSAKGIWTEEGMALIRILTGTLVVYHGVEVFRPEIMNGYLTWDVFNNAYGKFLVYAGKSTELLSGLLILFGFYTRIGSILLMGAMLFITFYVGQGRFWYEEQHPFLFAVIGLTYFFYGSGIWSIDSLLNKGK